MLKKSLEGVGVRSGNMQKKISGKLTGKISNIYKEKKNRKSIASYEDRGVMPQSKPH